MVEVVNLDEELRRILAKRLEKKDCFKYATFIGLTSGEYDEIKEASRSDYEIIWQCNEKLHQKKPDEEWFFINKALQEMDCKEVIEECQEYFTEKRDNPEEIGPLYHWGKRKLFFYGYKPRSVRTSKREFLEPPKEVNFSKKFGQNGYFVKDMNREDFENESISNFNNYLKDNDGPIEPIVVNHDENIVKLLESLCKKVNDASSKLYLICKYNPSKHFEFLGYSCHPKKLPHLVHRDCFIAYLQKENIFLLIQTAKEIIHSKNELEDSFFNATLVYLMNKEILEGSNACIMAFVAAPGTRKDFVSRQYIEENIGRNLFVFSEETSDEERFVDFFREKINFVNDNREKNKKYDSNIFKVMGRKVFAFLATVENYLPISKQADDGSSPTEKRYLFLYKKQREVLETPKKHIIITGHYGSGKTILAMLKLERTLEECNENSIIYFISYDPLSIIDSFMKEFRSPIIPRKSVRSLILSKCLSDSLKELRKQHLGQKMLVIVDEYNGEELTEKEARKIKSLLDEDFKECLFILIPQTMKAIRKKTSFEYKTHMFKETGMDIYELPHTMRTNVSINKFINVAEEIVSREEKKLYLDKKWNKPSPIYTEEGIDDPKSKKSLTTNQKSSNIKKEFDNKSDLDQESSSSSDLKKEFEDLPVLNEDKGFSCEPDLDEALRVAKKPWYLPSNFNVKFTCGDKSKLGHSIDDEITVLIKFTPSNNSTEKAYAWFCLCKRILKMKGKKVVLCMNTNDCEYIAKVFKHFKYNAYIKYTSQGNDSNCFTLADKDNAVKHFLEEKLLVTDVRAFRGMECENMMVVLDSKECALYQNVVQAIARCTKKLTIITPSKSLKNQTLRAIVKGWEQLKGGREVQTKSVEAEFLVKNNIDDYRAMTNGKPFCDNDSDSEVFKETQMKTIDRYFKEWSNEEYLATPSGLLRNTPLHDAVVENDLDKIKKLLNAGANINVRAASYKYTPLHFASTRECVDLLLKKGADDQLKDEFGRTPIKAAEIGNRREAMQALKEYEIIYALENNKEEDLRSLIISTTKDEVSSDFFYKCLKSASDKNSPNFVGYVMYKSPNKVEEVIRDSAEKNHHLVTAMLLLCWAAINDKEELLDNLLHKQSITAQDLPELIKEAVYSDLDRLNSAIRNKEIQLQLAVSLALQKSHFKAAFVLLKELFSDEVKKEVIWSGLVIKEIHVDWFNFLEKFETIDLSNNKLSLLKSKLFELPNLVCLNISGNELKELPKIINWSSSLTVLDLSKNKLSKLGETFNNANLKKLILAENLLKEVPSSIRSIKCLETLDVSKNVEISSLPGFLCKIDSLQNVFVSSKVKFDEKLAKIVKRK